MEFAPFYVGQKVEALFDYSICEIKKGDIFVVLEILPGCCNKHSWIIYIGIDWKHGSYCPSCLHSYRGPKAYFATNYFKALDEKFETISYSKVMEKESSLICVN